MARPLSRGGDRRSSFISPSPVSTVFQSPVSAGERLGPLWPQVQFFQVERGIAPLNAALGWNGPGAVFRRVTGDIGVMLRDGAEYEQGSIPASTAAAVEAAVEASGGWGGFVDEPPAAFGRLWSDAHDYMRMAAI